MNVAIFKIQFLLFIPCWQWRIICWNLEGQRRSEWQFVDSCLRVQSDLIVLEVENGENASA